MCRLQHTDCKVVADLSWSMEGLHIFIIIRLVQTSQLKKRTTSFSINQINNNNEKTITIEDNASAMRPHSR